MNAKLVSDEAKIRRHVGRVILRDYQVSSIQKVFDHFVASSEPITLGVAPSGGKTFTSIAVAEEYLEKGLGKRVLVLTHGTNVLKTQFAADIETVQPKFSRKMINNVSDIDESEMLVAIPQSLRDRSKLPRIDLLIVDEAHQFYFANMVQDLIAFLKPTHQLLLTGTPSPMVKAQFPIIATPLAQIMNADLAADLRIIITKTPYKFTHSDYNSSQELRSSIPLSEADTITTLEEAIGKLHFRSVADFTNYHKKSMIACRNQNQAKALKCYLSSLGVDSALSVSDTDSDGSEIQRFRVESNCQFLIVVGRGVLGFNMPALEVVIDMTGSQNIDRVYQLMARVFRKSSGVALKYFVKVASEDMSQYMGHVMTAVLCLTQEEWFTKYNGENFLDLPLPVTRRPNLKANTGDPKPDEQDNDANPTSVRPAIDFSEVGPPIQKLFNALFVDKEVFYTTLGIVRQTCFGNSQYEKWTLESCKKDALKFNSRGEWRTLSRGASQAAKRNGWFDECCTHMELRRQVRTLEGCMQDALKYRSRREWHEGNHRVAEFAKSRGWAAECCKHMVSGLNMLHSEKQIQQMISADIKPLLKSCLLIHMTTDLTNAECLSIRRCDVKIEGLKIYVPNRKSEFDLNPEAARLLKQSFERQGMANFASVFKKVAVSTMTRVKANVLNSVEKAA